MKFAAAVTLAFAFGCSPRVTNIGENVDAGPPITLTLTGQVCTAIPDPSGFPVKLVLLVDQSGMSCIIDPPGSQGSPGFCEMYATIPPGVTQPARVRGLNRLLDALEASPNVSVAMVPYETNVKGVWPTSNFGHFARPDSSLRSRVNSLQAELGDLRDVQGALSYAAALITADVTETEQTRPEVLANTRYVVVLMANGPPVPRCSMNDSLSLYADDLRPAGQWPDSNSTYCNVFDPLNPDAITGFIAGGDRNQDAQLVAFVDRLEALQQTSKVGDIRLHTVLFTNDESIRNCGALCAELFGPRFRWPGPVPVQNANAAAKLEAQSLMRLLAQRGEGAFFEFDDFAGLSMFQVSNTTPFVDLGSFASFNVKRALFVQPTMSIAWKGAWAVDSDGDGVPDSVESIQLSDPRSMDSDGDGFNDRFELQHASEGFDLLSPDVRGCIPTSPLTPNCTVRDVDGDGLTQFEENYLRTNSTIVDTDRDTIPDGLEVRWGLDPLVALSRTDDSDDDGYSDLDEISRATDPLFADADLSSITVTTVPRMQPSSAFCYDFTVTGLPMLETPGFFEEPVGVSSFRVWFEEAPELAVLSAGVWQSACTFARRDLSFDPPRLVPTGLEANLFAGDFVPPWALRSPADFLVRCRNENALHQDPERR